MENKKENKEIEQLKEALFITQEQVVIAVDIIMGICEKLEKNNSINKYDFNEMSGDKIKRFFELSMKKHNIIGGE